MKLSRVVLPPLLGTVLLSGCVAATQSASSAPRGGPDCSFRSATTCWTLAGRFPQARAAKPDSVPKKLLDAPAAVLASRGDSVPASR
jgi:hypothetical protein